MKTAFVIIRVSAEDQLRGYGPEVQWSDDILPAAPVLGLGVSENYRRVLQESATGWERPLFEAAVREAMSLYQVGRVQALLFPRVDRETRFIFASFPLLTEVIQSGMEVYFAREKLFLNPNDPESIERYLNKATQAQAYIQTMKFNTSQAKKRLLREGKLPQGTGVGMYGYDWNRQTKRRDINEAEAEIVKEIFNRAALGESLVSIVRDLNQRGVPTKVAKDGEQKRTVWYYINVKRMIRNEAYIGRMHFCDTVLPDVTPAIISEDLFHAANAQLDKLKLREGRAKHEYLLRGHIFCAICGKPLVGHCLRRKYRYYQCSTNTRPYENSGKKCPALYVRSDELEDIVWDKTHEVLSNPDIVLANLADVNNTANLETIETEIVQLGKSLRSYDKRRTNLLEGLELGEFDKDEILDRLNNLKRLRQADEARLNELTRTRDNITGLASARMKLGQLYDRVLDNLQNATLEIKALALDALDIKVYARGTEKVEIQGVIPLAVPMIEQSSA